MSQKPPFDYAAYAEDPCRLRHNRGDKIAASSLVFGDSIAIQFEDGVQGIYPRHDVALYLHLAPKMRKVRVRLAHSLAFPGKYTSCCSDFGNLDTPKSATGCEWASPAVEIEVPA